jgi:hypothetical protein
MWILQLVWLVTSKLYATSARHSSTAASLLVPYTAKRLLPTSTHFVRSVGLTLKSADSSATSPSVTLE